MGPLTLAEGSTVLSLMFYIGGGGRSQHQVNRVNLEKQSCNLGSKLCARKISGFFTLTAGVFLATWSANSTSPIKHNSAKLEVKLT